MKWNSLIGFEVLGGVVLLEEVSPWGWALRFQKSILDPDPHACSISLSSLSLLLFPLSPSSLFPLSPPLPFSPLPHQGGYSSQLLLQHHECHHDDNGLSL